MINEPKKKRTTTPSPLQMRAHNHNLLSGRVRMAYMNMGSIISSDTTTNKAKQLANSISLLLNELEVEIKIRVD